MLRSTSLGKSARVFCLGGASIIVRSMKSSERLAALEVSFGGASFTMRLVKPFDRLVASVAVSRGAMRSILRLLTGWLTASGAFNGAFTV